MIIKRKVKYDRFKPYSRLNGLNDGTFSFAYSKLSSRGASASALVKPPRPKEVTNWPSTNLRVGQITAVAINPDGNPVIFHRGDRIWNEE